MYSHITREDRVEIAALLYRGWSYARIGKRIGVHRSTVMREVLRNRCADGTYRSRKAHKKALERRKYSKCGQRSIENNPAMYEKVVSSLKQYWSPDQIVGRMKKMGMEVVSHTTIYSFIERERNDLRAYLRHRKHRRRRKTAEDSGVRRITERPKVVEERSRVGDWEGDTIVGAEKVERICTNVDRMSGLLVALRTKADSFSVFKAIKKAFAHLPCKTFTFDNGSEFAAHKLIEKFTGAFVYFAHPGSPHERGTNENTNALLRQFFPKGSAFATITQEDVDRVVNLINNRPRKRLNYATPLEVFMSGRECCS